MYYLRKRKLPKSVYGMEGFDRNLRFERLKGITKKKAELFFKVKWAGIDELELVPAAAVYRRQPQAAIKFFETRFEIEISMEITHKGKKLLAGFDRKRKPSQIVGLVMSTSQRHYLIQWHGLDVTDMVLATEANRRCPNLVLKFFQDRLDYEAGEEVEKRGENN